MEKGEVAAMAKKLVPNMEAEMKVKPTENNEQKKPWHKPKNGSIFPAKRKSVKQMMWDFVFGPNMGFMRGSPSSKPKSNNSVHPCSSSHGIS